jgi:hypothetical protein
MTTKLTMSTAALAIGLIGMTAPALAQQPASPKSGPDINQPKYMPESSKDKNTPSTTGAGAGAGPRDNSVSGGGDSGGGNASSGSGEAAGNSGGSSGGSGGSSGSGGNSN